MVKKRSHKPRSVDIHDIFLGLQKEMSAKLAAARKVIHHPSTKGDVSENSWLELLNTYLPKRYSAQRAIVIDSDGLLSDAIDIVVFDRHFSPFILHHHGGCYIPAESVYAVFEVKQEITNKELAYAEQKAASIRKLKRTSAPIPHAGGVYTPVKPKEIICGVLALKCDAFKKNMQKITKRLLNASSAKTLNIGCFLDSGAYAIEATSKGSKTVKTFSGDVALIGFFLSFLHALQQIGSAPAMDILAYRKRL